MPQRFRLLTEAHVSALLPLSDLITAMETALARFSAGEVLQPVRSVLMVGPQKAYFGLMPAYVADPPQLGAKIVTVFGDNHARGLPSHLATILLLDPDTGALIALMDGRYITEARTAAVSAVSARHLARPEASTLAILGAGVQARSHLEAIAAVRPIRHARIWSPTAASRERFVAEMSGHVPAALTAASSAEAAVRGADIVVLVTSSPTPVLDHAWVAPGTHVISVGACRPDHREMEPALVAASRLVVDSRAAALVESGDVVAASPRAASARPTSPASSATSCAARSRDGPRPTRSPSSSPSAWPSKTSWPRTWSTDARSRPAPAPNSRSEPWRADLRLDQMR